MRLNVKNKKLLGGTIMNTTITTRIKAESPVIKDISEKEANLYKGALILLASIVSDSFIDIPELPHLADRPNTDGLCYCIPFLDSSMLYASNNERDLLIVWQTIKGASDCPLRISVKFTTHTNYTIRVHNQSGERTISRDLYSRNADERTTEITGYDTITLSQLMTIK